MAWKKRLNSFFKNRDFATFLLFVILATIIWYGHAMVTQRDGKISVHIDYLGISNDVAFTDSLPRILELEVRDAGGRLRAYRGHQLNIEFDLTSQLMSEEGEIRLSTDIIRRGLSDILLGTTKLQHVSPEVIHSTYYRQQEKIVPVEAVYDLTLAAQHQLSCPVRIIPDSIAIYGTRRQLDAVESVKTERIEIANVADSVIVKAPLVAIPKIRFALPEITLAAYAELYTEKAFVLPIQTEGVPEGERLQLFPQEANIVARVSVANFTQVAESDIVAYCQYPQTNNKLLEVKVRYSNSYITNIRVVPHTVEYLIEK